MSRSRARLAADWFAKLRQNAVTNVVEHIDVTDVSDTALHSGSSLNAATLTGALPAIDGSALTGIEGVPAGVVIYQAANTAPTGFIKANGASLSTTTYANLFAAIGYTFGGSGSSFNVPDLRGEFIRGWDDGRGVDSGRSFGSFQSDAFKSHTHRIYGGKANNWFNVYSRSGNWGNERYFTSNQTNSLSTGGADTRPRNRALLACIKI